MLVENKIECVTISNKQRQIAVYIWKNYKGNDIKMGVKQDLVLLLYLINIIFWYFSSCLFVQLCVMSMCGQMSNELRYYNFLVFSTLLPLIFPEGILAGFYLYL